MKNYKKIIYLLFLSLIVVSCGEDEVDSVTNPGTFTIAPEEVKASFKDSNFDAIVAEGETTTYRMGLAQRVDAKVEVYLDVTSTDGEVEATYPNPIVIERGEAEVFFDFSPTADGVAETESYTLSIKDIKVTFTDGATIFFTHTGDNARTLTVTEPIITTVGEVEVKMTWSNASRDMDLFLVDGDQNLSGTVIDSSIGITTTEITTLPSSHPDGIFSVYINQWAFTADVDYTMMFTFPDGQVKEFNSTVSEDSFVFTVDKTTSGADVSYSITPL